MIQLDLFENISELEVLLTEFGKEKEKYERCQRSFFQRLDQLQKKAETLKKKDEEEDK